MLSIGKLGAGQENYYLAQVAEGAEDYYRGEGEAEGRWAGDAARDLGLEGPVEAEALSAMLTGRNPATGEPLGLRAVGGRGPVPGFDLTFSAPKSVSLLWALGGPVAAAEVSAAHQRSVEAALSYMQRQACLTRRGADAEFVKGNGYLAAAFTHRSSRAGDPQLHTHLLIANATQGPDGRWSRLYHPAIYDHAKTAGYIYEAQLRHELSRHLDVRWQEVRNGIAELVGFSGSHLREFSTRRQQILEAAGPDASARARQIATLTTREAKEKDLTQETLRQRWHSKAQEIGLDRETIEQTFDPEAGLRIAVPGAEPHTVSTEQLGRAVTAAVSHFDRRDAVQAVAQLGREGMEAGEVERATDAYLASEDVIEIAESAKGPRFTTRRIWELEREALATVERMRTQGPPPAGELIAARVIGARPTLKDDQAEMVRRLLTEREGVAVVIGEAGTGKTYATLAAAEGWAQAGTELRAAAPTWRAANVMRDEGLAAISVASLLIELDRAEHEGNEGLAQGSVLLIDEAGMVDSAALARLVSHAEAAEAKLVLVGDPEQLGEIEAGGLFRAVAERTEPIQLDQVIRHHHDLDREAAKRIREGEGGEALSLYRTAERVIVAPDAEARREAMVADWHRSFERGEDAVMIAKRNVEVERLNELARSVRKEAGKLGGEEIQVGESMFTVGDQVITRVNDQSQQIYNRERWRIADVDAEARSVVLDGIDTRRRVCVDAVYLERVNPYNEAPALEHAYAVTTYSAQGTTVDRAYVMADPSMDKQELYVAASRSREETWLYATPEIQASREEIAPRSPYLREGIPHIVEAAERDRAQVAAHDVAQLQALPSAELIESRDALQQRRFADGGKEARLREASERVERSRELLARAEAKIAAAEGQGRKGRKELAELRRSCRWVSEGLANRERELAELPRPQETEALRVELATVEQVLAQRRQLALTAAHIAPPRYITTELGERPTDPVKRQSWERGVIEIEGYRSEHGVSDGSRAFGSEPKGGAERARREGELRRLRQLQRELGREAHREHTRELGRGMGIGR